MKKYTNFTIINNDEATIIIGWKMFSELLNAVPKSVLIDLFATDKETEIAWWKLSRAGIIDRIYGEYET